MNEVLLLTREKEIVAPLKPTYIPTSTYRLQLNKNFGFEEARRLIPYLQELGITDCYLSPIFLARPGSRHGYDVVDHGLINPELGGEEKFVEFAQAAKRKNIRVLLDVVPNHMCITDPNNRWWSEVLEDGPASLQSDFFDINWHPIKKELTSKVLLPFLGDQYGKVLENGEIQVTYSDGAFVACYYDFRFPLDPQSWHLILTSVLEKLSLDKDHPHRMELESILNSLNYLPPRTEISLEKKEERRREKEIIRKRLKTLVDEEIQVKSGVDSALRAINGTKGDPQSFDRLEAVLEAQAYRLCDWRVATDEINYRRFFDLNELAAIRVEKPDVFQKVHELVFRYIREGWVHGLRIDHVDGLFDPDQYLTDIQTACRPKGARSLKKDSPEEADLSSFYIVVEKILSLTEKLKSRWPVFGTTGYDFLNVVNGLFVNSPASEPFHKFYRRFTGQSFGFSQVVITCKKLIMLVSMAGELRTLAFLLDRISEQHRWSRDFTQESLRFALREVIACFPVYRSYIRREQVIDRDDRELVIRAVEEAKHRNPATTESIFDFIQSVLLLNHPEGLSEEQKRERVEFVLRLQQLTSPVMAKGWEDTAFYRHTPLVSLNEVGGSPDQFGISLGTFHRYMRDRFENWPHSLSASSTHDTKRSEDVRARINVLSEIPSRWIRAVRRWHSMNTPKKARLNGAEAPDVNEEYLLYQTLVGTWPLKLPEEPLPESYIERIQNFLTKAIREAKIHSSWIKPYEAYERAVGRFVKVLLSSDQSPFLNDFTAFHESIFKAGLCNSLSQTLLKIACPGVPDFYQGTETWNFSLVDPDNRRPVDFASLERLLPVFSDNGNGMSNGFVKDLWDQMSDGRIKTFLIHKGLKFRRDHSGVFEKGGYFPLRVKGERKRNLIALARLLGNQQVVVLAGRFFMDFYAAGNEPLGRNAWGETSVEFGFFLKPGVYYNVLTGESFEAKDRLLMAEALNRLPVALLARRP